MGGGTPAARSGRRRARNGVVKPDFAWSARGSAATGSGGGRVHGLAVQGKRTEAGGDPAGFDFLVRWRASFAG